MKTARRILPMAMFLFLGTVSAQTPLAPLSAIPTFPIQSDQPLRISRQVDPARPFTVVGPRGALLGRQNGSFEAWIFPWKIFSDMHITAETQNYGLPIDVNNCAAWID